MIHIKHIFLTALILLSSTILRGQSVWMEIPLGYEQNPTGKDSFFPYFQERRPKIALALSGGGARGLAHIGVLKVLEKYGLPIDGIAGTSMGAVVGGLTAVGYSASEIDSIARNTDWDEIIKDAPPRRQLFLGQKEQKSRSIFQIRFEKMSLDFRPAYTSGQKLTTLLTDILLKAPCPFQTDDQALDIPLKVITTDLLTGKKVVFDKSSLVDALRATLAIPLLFTPVEMDSFMLVDGGLRDNLPVDEARSIPADLVIAVDTSSKVRNRESIDAPWEIADQVTTIMQQDALQSQMQNADVVIQPMLVGISNTDFGNVANTIQAGEKAAEEVMPRIESLLTDLMKQPEDEYYNVRKCAFIGLENFSFDSQGIAFHPPKPGRLSMSEFILSGRALYETGYFKNVRVKLDTLNQLLLFSVEENPLVRQIVFKGNTQFSDSALLAGMETRGGEPLNIHKGRRDLRLIRSLYLKKGFSLARILYSRVVNDSLVITLDEGRISDFRFNGNHRSLPFVIQREIPFHRGDLFHVSRFKQAVENLYSTGYFESIRFDLKKIYSDYSLNLDFKEQGFTLLRAGLRYDLERQAQGFLETVEENLFGVGAEGSVTGLIGTRDQIFRAAVRTDQILNSLFTAQLSFTASSQDYRYYESYRQTGSYRQQNMQTVLSVGQQMKRLGTLSFQLRNENIRLIQKMGDRTPNESFVLRNIVIRSEVDTRDRLPFPSMGKYHVFEYETSAKFLDSRIPYARMFSSMESYYPFPGGLVLRPRIRWGTADLTTPFVKQYKFGGIESFIGIPEESLMGRQFIIFSGEARVHIPFPRWLESYVSFRYDLGGGWPKYVHINARDFRQGVGLVFSVNTPFGPFLTGVGLMKDENIRVYFSAGYRF
jgi:NTE family protein